MALHSIQNDINRECVNTLFTCKI